MHHSEKERLNMFRRTTIVALLVALTLAGLGCSKSGTAVANMSEDDKHKIFQAVGMTRDMDLAAEVFQKIGLIDSNKQPTPAYDPFLKAHTEWATKNADFIKEYMTADKAREYVNTHMPK